jgi:pimeloyl-ACP methyl ester carboxylesterase
MNIFIHSSLIMIFSTMMALPVQATDSAKEERWANQVSDFLLDGDTEWLEVNGTKFLSIYTPATTDKTVGAVILLHGRGAHPDWPQVIQPLRTQLPEKGWATLSLQMPVLSSDTYDRDYVPLFDEVPERIKAALDFLSQKNINNIVLMGHSLGATMATDYLAKHRETRIKAFVGIGMKAMKQTAGYHVLDNAESLKTIKLPVLDIYGSKTIEEILYSADRRSNVINRTGHVQSRQVKLEGTGHFFQGYEDKLLDNIVTWMNETTGNNKQSKSVVNANVQ